jgi:hypothetical protein
MNFAFLGLLAIAADSTSADLDKQICPPGSFCQKFRSSPVIDEFLCAVAREQVKESSIPKESLVFPKEHISEAEFKKVETIFASVLRGINIKPRPSFGPSDAAATQYLLKAGIPASEQEWFARHLRVMREPELSEAGSETYRFLWLRTFHAPIAVRVEATATGARLVGKMLSGAGGYQSGTLCDRVDLRISDGDVTRIRACMRQVESRPKDGSVGLDGSEWIIESRTNAGYSFAKAWTPETGSIRECGLLLLTLSGLPLDPIY